MPMHIPIYDRSPCAFGPMEYFVTRDNYEKERNYNKFIYDYMILGEILLTKFGLRGKIQMNYCHMDEKKLGVFSTKNLVITLNSLFFNEEYRSKMVETIAHEVAHAIEYELYGFCEHKENFQEIFNAIYKKQ